jgi:hypothetical protein
MTGGAVTSRTTADRWNWQAIDSGRLLLMAVAGMLVIAAFAHTTISNAHIQWPPALAFGGFIAFGELLRLALPGGREAAPIAMVGALSYALLLRVSPAAGASARGFGNTVANQDALLVVAVAAVGMVVGALPHVAAGRPAGLTGMCTRLIAVACVAFIFRPVARYFQPQSLHHAHYLHWYFAMIVIVAVVVFGWLVDTVIGALIRADDIGSRFSVALVDEIRLQWLLGAAVGAWVLITVFGAEVMGIAELAVFIGPLLVTQLAFRRYAGIRATYLQTVRSLARVTEVAGYVEEGHSQRVSRLAVSAGRVLGMTEPELLALEYAAVMHDIGQLSLRDPIPGGATLLASPADQQRIAELGAEIISEAGVLDDVAELVRCQSWPASHDPAPPQGSMIIRAANAFDDMVGGGADRERSTAALDRMRLNPDEYDSQVVRALAEVAGRRPFWRL